jgi:flagellar hook assembly protein FlgD
MRSISVVLAGIIAILFLGCATTGEIPISLSPGAPLYISPANADGIQDAVTFSLLVTPLERTGLAAYEIDVRAADGTVVYEVQESIERPGFFQRLFGGNERPAVAPPELVLWDGRSTDGALVPDGTYSMSVSVADDRGNTGTDGPREIIVDNTPPSLVLTAPFTLFTPNGDGRLETIQIYQARSTAEDEWVGIILNESGQQVRRFSWAGRAPNFEWNGRTDGDRDPVAGLYRYTVAATDKAGNSASYSIESIELELEPRPATITNSRPALSPNGDGRADTLEFRVVAENPARVQSWRIDVLAQDASSVRSFTGRTLPPSLIFDGESDAGSAVADGTYRAVLTLTYVGGQELSTAGTPFRVDTRAPVASARASRAVFSPDGDGQGDVVELRQSSSNESTWVGTLSDESGAVLLTQTWEGQVQNFTWDGTGSNGDTLPDGVYVYSVVAEDEAENASPPLEVRIRLDTAPVTVSVGASDTAFSPNGDRLRDSVTFSLTPSRNTDIIGWSLEIVGSNDQRIGRLASGRAVPQSVMWDGRIEGAPAADGEYRAEFVVTYERGTIVTGRSRTVSLDATAPRVSASASPVLFSPDDDGENDILSISISTTDSSSIQRWRAELFDREDNLFRSWSGNGTPRGFTWDGLSEAGELVQSAEDYRLIVTATDAVWNTGSTEIVIPIDILVLREGDRLRVRIASIYFVPFTADYRNLPEQQAKRNIETLDRLAEVLEKFPDRQIRVEGHAVQVLWENPVRAAREQQDVLLPLSIERAEAIRGALAERGVALSRMTAAGFGGANPVVPHSDLDERWKNRRVEFILVPRQ